MSLMLGYHAHAQDLLAELEASVEQPSSKVEATFKGTRLIHGHSVETRKKGVLDFLISHRFGQLNSGAYELFGLDQSNVRIGFDYGLVDRLNIGIGRNSFEKTFDSYLKYRLLWQSEGEKSMPVSVTLFSSVAIKTLKDAELNPSFGQKMVFTEQMLIARKFGSALSLQLSPTFIHYNLLNAEQTNGNLLALGIGGRVKLTKRVSLNAEYYYRFNELQPDRYNSLALGFDIETGGHVFQLQFSNSRSMIEKGFIEESTGQWGKSDIHFGFNISRSFQLIK